MPPRMPIFAPRYIPRLTLDSICLPLGANCEERWRTLRVMHAPDGFGAKQFRKAEGGLRGVPLRPWTW